MCSCQQAKHAAERLPRVSCSRGHPSLGWDAWLELMAACTQQELELFVLRARADSILQACCTDQRGAVVFLFGTSSEHMSQHWFKA